MSEMKAWVYDLERKPESDLHLYLETRPIPTPGPGDILLKVLKTSVCGTDEMLFSGNLRRARNGIIPGHEFCGEIVEIGSHTEGFGIGEVIAGESHYGQNGIEEEGVIGLWPPRLHGGVEGRVVEGAYAEYVCIPAECAHRIPRDLSDGNFWPSLFEPAGNDFLLARLVVDEMPSDSVGVFGCGPHGLYAQVFLRHFGLERLVAFETDPYRRNFAREMGCVDQALDPRHDISEVGPFDVTLDMVGKQGQAFRQCCDLTRDRGSVVLFGLFHKEFEIGGRPANELIFGRKTVEIDHRGKRLQVVGVTGREGIWPELIETVGSSSQLQALLMKPVEVVGPLDLLGDEIQRNRPQTLKRAFWEFD